MGVGGVGRAGDGETWGFANFLRLICALRTLRVPVSSTDHVRHGVEIAPEPCSGAFLHTCRIGRGWTVPERDIVSAPFPPPSLPLRQFLISESPCS